MFFRWQVFTPHRMNCFTVIIYSWYVLIVIINCLSVSSLCILSACDTLMAMAQYKALHSIYSEGEGEGESPPPPLISHALFPPFQPPLKCKIATCWWLLLLHVCDRCWLQQLLPWGQSLKHVWRFDMILTWFRRNSSPVLEDQTVGSCWTLKSS